nr:MAG TPA: hypothetical protein [Caudoviricetes sp.]
MRLVSTAIYHNYQCTGEEGAAKFASFLLIIMI